MNKITEYRIWISNENDKKMNTQDKYNAFINSNNVMLGKHQNIIIWSDINKIIINK